MASLLDSSEWTDADSIVDGARNLERLVREAEGEAASTAFQAAFEEVNENAHGIFFLLLSKTQLVFARLAEDPKTAEKQAEGFFVLLMRVMKDLESIESVTECVSSLTEVLAVQDQLVRFRVKMLMFLHNFMRADSHMRTTVNQAISQLASSDDSGSTSQFVKQTWTTRKEAAHHATPDAAVEALVASCVGKALVHLTTNEAVAVKAIKSGAIRGSIDLVGQTIVLENSNSANIESCGQDEIKAALEKMRH